LANAFGVPELRRDYFTDRLTLTNTERNVRGTDIEAEEEQGAKCFVCEYVDPKSKPSLPLIIEHPDNLSVNAVSEKSTHNVHQVLVANLTHNSSFQKLPVDSIAKLLSITQEGVRLQYGKKESFVLLLARYGNATGGIMHPSLEMLTLPETPSVIKEEMAAVERSMQDLGVCPMCRVISIEQGGPRQLISTEHFIAFAPWAPTSSHEFWIYPKSHEPSFLRASSKAITDLALILRSTLGGMHRELGGTPFTLSFHSINEKMSNDYHWHIEVHPMLKTWGSIEKGLGVYVNDIPPEMTGEVLGKAARKELAELIGI
jgi:UDPglucose--hexose-1-phosphate uridylyltransferase